MELAPGKTIQHRCFVTKDVDYDADLLLGLDFLIKNKVTISWNTGDAVIDGTPVELEDCEDGDKPVIAVNKKEEKNEQNSGGIFWNV